VDLRALSAEAPISAADEAIAAAAVMVVVAAASVMVVAEAAVIVAVAAADTHALSCRNLRRISFCTSCRDGRAMAMGI
jgi:hypothetical protein